MAKKEVPAFIRPYSISILDGDVRKNTTMMKKLNTLDNILLLPGTESPERCIAYFLKNLSDKDDIWETIAAGYTKQVCFRTYSYESIMGDHESGRQIAKQWFNEQLSYWGRNGIKVLNPYFKTISEDVERFIADFDRITSTFIHG